MDVKRLYALFDEGSALPESEREAFVENACADDPSLATRLRKMLAESLHTEEVMGAATTVAADLVRQTPERVGAYRIIEELGRGGMGVVYRAEQEQPRREVALKVILPGLASAGLRRRFEHEAGIVGLLRHPGIAQIYEAGTADMGEEERPFFAMELVEGRPIDEHVVDRPVRDRLELFALVCDAVDHAHQKGIVHRDLKPANILVVQREGLPDAPKVLDFGVARMAEPDTHVSTLHTQAGQIIGTVGYMSPEQLSGRSSEVDARSDVYALGVVLYSILTGRMPHDLHGRHIAEIVRVVHEEDPTRLSQLDRTLAGDLEVIVEKALETEPDRRYVSAAALAKDVRRHLANEPIAARAPSLTYRMSKFARRHKALVGGVAATVFALSAGLVGTTSALITATQEREAKEKALASSNAVTEFLTEVLEAADPMRGNKDVTVRETLNDAAEKLGDRFKDEPAVEGRLRLTLGRTYFGLGANDQAIEQLRRALELLEPLADAAPNALEASDALGDALYTKGAYESALEVLEDALARDLELGTPNAELRVRLLLHRAVVLMSRTRFDDARTTFDEALALVGPRVSPEHPTAISLSSNIAILDMRSEQFDDAVKRLEDVRVRAARVYGPEHPETLSAIGNLAAAHKGAKRWEPALELSLEAAALQKKIMGPAHRQTLISLNNAAQMLAKLGRHDEALTTINGALDLAIKTYDENSSNRLFLRYTLGRVHHDAGRLKEAEKELRAVVGDTLRILGPDSEYGYWTTVRLVDVLLDLEKFDEAKKRTDALLAISTKKAGANHPRAHRVALQRARAVAGLGDFAEARKEFERISSSSSKELAEEAKTRLSKL